MATTAGQRRNKTPQSNARDVTAVGQGKGSFYSALEAARDVVRAGFTKDHAIARLAERQHGVVTWAQLRAIGLGEGAIESRIARSYLHRVHRGVYRVGHTAPLPFAREMAAVLACGDFAALSHGTAAAVGWRFVPEDGTGLHVTVAGGGRRQRAGIRVHRSPLGSTDVTRLQGVPVTSPTRTLLDLAATAPPLLLERALEDARRRRLVTTGGLLAALERSPSRAGSPALRALLQHERGPALTRSAAERKLVELVRLARLPPPEHNVAFGPYELDVLWRAYGLAAEVDGFAYHGGRAAFERDRKRDADLQAAGLRVMRITWRQLVDEPEAVAARLGAALLRRPIAERRAG